MSEVSVPMDDKALFSAAMSDPAPETPATETPAAAPEQTDAGPARDEAGRFAPKVAAEPEPAPPAAVAPEAPKAPPAPAEAKQEAPPGWIPAWRAREIAENRAREVEARYAAKQQPQEEIDPYADPTKFRDAGVKQAIDPVQQRMDALREHYSWKDALREHKDVAVEARKWFYDAVHAGDANVAPTLQKALTSIDPFDDIVTAYKQHKALATIGTDPEAWFQKELERRKASDPDFAAKLAPQAAQAQPPGNVVRLPPSLNRQPGSAAAAEGSMNDADLFAHAMRK